MTARKTRHPQTKTMSKARWAYCNRAGCDLEWEGRASHAAARRHAKSVGHMVSLCSESAVIYPEEYRDG